MAINTAAKASYQVLGARETKLDAAAKEQAFNEAIDSIKHLLSKPNTDRPIRNVPQLVREIFDLTKSDPDLEKIREVIRSNDNIFGLDKLSASGNKLLATLAIIQYPDKCFSADGKLRVEFTASVMRGWFDNGADLIIDRSALQNFQKNPLDPTGQSIKLGKNRLAGIQLTDHSTISQALDKNKKSVNLGEQKIPVNIQDGQLPAAPPPELRRANEITGGDMHGNSKMLTHFLVQTGIARVKGDAQKPWKELMRKIDDNDVAGFKETLPHCLELVTPPKNLVLLGDLLADRGQNDWFTLCILEFLHDKGQPFDVIFSNHDAAFVEYYLDNKNKSLTEPYAVSQAGVTQHGLQGDQGNSLINLNTTLNEGPGKTREKKRQAFNEMTEKYLGHVKLVECHQDQRSLYSHGVMNDALLFDLATLSGLNEHQQSETGLQEKVHVINRYFRSALQRDGEYFRQMMNLETGFGEDKAKPFAATIWNDGPKRNNRLKDAGITKKPDHRYTQLPSPDQFDTLIHGHTEDLKEAKKTEFIDHKNKIAAAKKSMMNSMEDIAAEKKKAPADLFQPQWNFVRDAVAVSLAPKDIAAAIFSLIKQVEIQGSDEGRKIASALIKKLQNEQNNQEVTSDLDKLFKQCLPTRVRSDYLKWEGLTLQALSILMTSIRSLEETFQQARRQVNTNETSPLQQAAEAAYSFNKALSESTAITDNPADDSADQISANDPVHRFISLDGSTGKSKNHLKGDLPIFAA